MRKPRRTTVDHYECDGKTWFTMSVDTQDGPEGIEVTPAEMSALLAAGKREMDDYLRHLGNLQAIQEGGTL